MVQIGSFNPNEVPDAGFEPMPEGRYTFIVSNSEMKVAKSGANNRYLAATLTVVDGPMKGRKLFENFNIWNASPKAAAMAKAAFRDLCWACEIFREVTDSCEIHNIPFQADVTIEDNGDKYGAQNRVKAYIHGKSKADVAVAPSTPAASVVSGPGDGAAPWAKG